MTANAFTEDHQGCIDAGMNNPIGKPFKPSKLYQIILIWIDGKVRES
jgi:CheY-like chemotaxis protein